MRLTKNTILYKLAVLFFVFVFLNDTTVYNVYFDDISRLILITAVFFAFVFIFVSRRFRINNRFILFVLFWFICTLIPCVLAGLTRFYFVRICYWILTMIVVLGIHTEKLDLKRIIYDVCKVFCVWCLICYFYTSLDLHFLPVTNVSSQLAYNWYSVKLHGYLVSNNISHFFLPVVGSLYRLDRPFGEPGIAQIFMNYGIIYNLFFIDKGKRQKVWIVLFVLGTVLSFSLIGYLILLVIMFVKLYRDKNYGLMILCSVFAVFIGMIMIIEKLASYSYGDRISDFSFMFKTIIQSFPFGIGIGHTGELEHVVLENGSTSIGFYCGLLYPLAQYGVFGLVYYWALFKALKSIADQDVRRDRKFAHLAFAAFILLTLLTEPQADEPLILCFVFEGLLLYFENKHLKQGENR